MYDGQMGHVFLLLREGSLIFKWGDWNTPVEHSNTIT